MQFQTSAASMAGRGLGNQLNWKLIGWRGLQAVAGCGAGTMPHLLAGDGGPQRDWHCQRVVDADGSAGLLAHRALQAEAAHGGGCSTGELDLVVGVLATGLVLECDARMHQPLHVTARDSTVSCIASRQPAV